MKRLLPALTAFLAAMAVAAASWAQDNALVTLKPEAVITGPTVRLSDLFEGLEALGAVADTPVARAPKLGTSVDLDPHWLGALARSYGLPWQPRTQFDRIRVERATRKVGSDEITFLLQEALQRRGASDNSRILLDNPTQQVLLPAELESGVSVAKLSHDPRSGRFVALLTASDGSTPQVQARITGRAVTMAEVPVLRRRLVPGEIIVADDIEWIEMPADRIARNVVVDQTGIVGKTPRRPVRAGEPLRGGELQTPIVVAKNNLVTIFLSTQRMQLSVQGRALEDGSRGEVIRVMNTASNTVINAVVVDAGKVEVVQASVAERQ